jgi:hypothetical protein
MSVLTIKKASTRKAKRPASKSARRRAATTDWQSFFETHPPVVAAGPTDLSTREGFGR